MSVRKTTRIALAVLGATLWGCSDATAPAADIDGIYVLESVSGRGPAFGTLILTRQGYAERRVRFRESNGGLSKEYLARGSAELQSDYTIALELREIGVASDFMWTPAARLVDGTVEIRHPDPADGPEIVERYRKKP